MEEASHKDGELYTGLVELYDNLLNDIHRNDEWIDNLNNLRDNFIISGALEKILYNTLKNFCDYLIAGSAEGNKLHTQRSTVFTAEIDSCIDKLNTNNEFKAKINRFVMDVLHRAALKGEDVILELARQIPRRADRRAAQRTRLCQSRNGYDLDTAQRFHRRRQYRRRFLLDFGTRQINSNYTTEVFLL